MNGFHIVVTSAVVAGALLSASAQTPNLANDLHRAKTRDIASGDCKSVLPEYMRIAEQGAKTDRASAAEALLRVGMCHEKSDNTQAKSFYQRVVDEFRDVPSVAAEAGRRLKQLASPPASGTQSPLRQLIWTPESGVAIYGRVSKDGRYLPYSTRVQQNDQLFIRDLVTRRDRQITSAPTGALEEVSIDGGATMSPNGRFAAFSWTLQDSKGFPVRQEIRIADLQTSGLPAPRTIFTAEAGVILRPHDWMPDGKSVVMEVHRDDSLVLGMLSVETGAFRVLREQPATSRPRNGAPVFVAPDGKHAALDVMTPGKPGRDILIVDLETNADTARISDSSDDLVAGWAADGSGLVFASDRLGGWALWWVPFTSRFLPMEPHVIARDIGAPDASLGVTSGGEVWSLKATRATSEVKVSAVDFVNARVLSAPSVVAVESLGTNRSPAWSPDGKFLAYLSRRGTVQVPRVVLVIKSLETNDIRELRPALKDIGPQTAPIRAVWNPDSRSMIVLGTGAAGYGFYLVDIRSGATTFLFTNDTGSSELLSLPFSGKSFSSDGTKMYYRRGSATEGAILERVLASGAERVVCTGSGADLSPDRRRFYCLRLPFRTGQQSIIETDLQSGATREIAAPASARRLWVSPDGQSILTAGQAAFHVLSIATASQATRLAPQDVRFLGWTPNSSAVLFGSGGGTLLAPVDGGPAQRLDAPGLEESLGLLEMHPDGRQIAQVSAVDRPLDEVWVLRSALPLRKGGRP